MAGFEPRRPDRGWQSNHSATTTFLSFSSSPCYVFLFSPELRASLSQYCNCKQNSCRRRELDNVEKLHKKPGKVVSKRPILSSENDLLKIIASCLTTTKKCVLNVETICRYERNFLDDENNTKNKKSNSLQHSKS